MSEKNIVEFWSNKCVELEARIKASQERKPFGYWHVGSCEDECDFFLARESGDVSCPDCVVLYAAPVIPPDVAELLRENAELTRKLAEQQAEIDRLMLEHCQDEMTDEQIENWAKYQIQVDAKIT